MGPELRRALVITEPVRVHEVKKGRIALQCVRNLRCRVLARLVAVLVERARALVRPEPVDAPRIRLADVQVPKLRVDEDAAGSDNLYIGHSRSSIKVYRNGNKHGTHAA